MQSTISNGIEKDKIGLEDLLGYGRLSKAMHEEYEGIKVELKDYNENIPVFDSENNFKWILDSIEKFIFDSEIDKERIDDFDDYIDKMVTLSEFDYETQDEKV